MVPLGGLVFASCAARLGVYRYSEAGRSCIYGERFERSVL